MTLPFKQLRQKVETNHPHMGWSGQLTREETREWQDLVRSTEPLKEFRVKRKFESDHRKQKLHLFCDASKIATGAVLYVESLIKTGEIHITLACAKSKIIPLKQQLACERTTKNRTPAIKINRLELQAAKMGIDLVQSFEHAIGRIFELHCWTDSQVVLKWLRKGPVTGTNFVDIRVTHILKRSNYTDWKHTPGVDNPADLATRGCTASELIQSPIWLTGPAWLSKPSEWPPQPSDLALFASRTGGKVIFFTLNERQFVINTRPDYTVPNQELDQYLIPNIIDPSLTWEKNVLRYSAIL